MDSSTRMEIPRAISGVEATRAIERMQCVWDYRANTVINVVLGAKMEYEQYSIDAISALDNSHERAYELGEGIDPAFNLEELEAATESLRQVITRGALQMKKSHQLSQRRRNPCWN